MKRNPAGMGSHFAPSYLLLFRQKLLFFFYFQASLHVGSQFPDQGLNPCLLQWKHGFFFFFFLVYFCLFIFGCTESLLLCVDFLQLHQAGSILQVWCLGFSLQWLPLSSAGSRRMGSAVVVHGLSYSMARGIIPDQGSNPGSMDSQPLDCWLSAKESMLLNCGVGEGLLRVPWTARRSNQSILKEISPEYLLEGLMLKLKLQYFGHLM